MVRQPLSPEERERGLRLGASLRHARGSRSMVDIAARAGVSVETLRKIETGRIPTPAFFTVVALADAVGLPVADLCELVASPEATPTTTSRRPVAPAGTPT